MKQDKKMYKCTKSFMLPSFDEDGHEIESRKIVVTAGTVFQKTNNNLIGGDIHLEENGTGRWIEITKERFEECFEKLR